jgi:hypothetical protein
VDDQLRPVCLTRLHTPKENTVPSTEPVSKTSLFAGHILGALLVLFLLFDSITKIIRERHVIEAFIKTGYPVALAPVIGEILLVCIIVYIIPRTSILGAILLTGYLGGATETNLRAGRSTFEVLLPVIFGVLVWAALYLRDRRLRSIIPVQR